MSAEWVEVVQQQFTPLKTGGPLTSFWLSRLLQSCNAFDSVWLVQTVATIALLPHFIRARKHQSKMAPLSLEDQLKSSDTAPSMKSIELINAPKRFARMQLKVETLSASQLKLWGKFLQALSTAMGRRHDAELKEKLKEKDNETRELEREKALLQKQVDSKTTIAEISDFEKHLSNVIRDPAFARHCLHRLPFPATNTFSPNHWNYVKMTRRTRKWLRQVLCFQSNHWNYVKMTKRMRKWLKLVLHFQSDDWKRVKMTKRTRKWLNLVFLLSVQPLKLCQND